MNDVNVNDYMPKEWIACTCGPVVICSVIAQGIMSNRHPVWVSPICFALCVALSGWPVTAVSQGGLLDLETDCGELHLLLLLSWVLISISSAVCKSPQCPIVPHLHTACCDRTCYEGDHHCGYDWYVMTVTVALLETRIGRFCLAIF